MLLAHQQNNLKQKKNIASSVNYNTLIIVKTTILSEFFKYCGTIH